MKNYNPYQENIAIVGMTGSGKTYLTRKILDMIKDVPRIIWSPQIPTINYAGLGEPVRSLNKLKRGMYIYTGAYNKKNFAEFMRIMMKLPNTLAVVDDVHEYMTKQSIPKEAETMINSGRNIGVRGIFITPSPQLVHNSVLREATHFFSFRMALADNALKWLAANRFGADAWCLTKKGLRQKTPTVGAEYEILPDHSYLYHHIKAVDNELHLGDAPDATE